MFAFQTRQAALTIAIIVTSSATLTAQRRTWTDSSGKFSVEAELEDAKQDSVVLKTAAGKSITIPISRLSKSDRDFLASLEAGGGKRTLQESGTRVGMYSAFAFSPDGKTVAGGTMALKDGQSGEIRNA